MGGSWEDGADSPKYIRGLTWEEDGVAQGRIYWGVAFVVGLTEGKSHQPSFSQGKAEVCNDSQVTHISSLPWITMKKQSGILEDWIDSSLSS